MKKWTVIIGLLLVLILVLVSACATSTPTPTKPAPATTAVPATTAAPTTAKPATTAPPATTAAAVSAADFYKNNTVTIFVGSKPGGGTDYAGRLLSAYWNEATGGTMIVKNEAGGGGLVNLNNIYKAKADGLTIGVSQLGGHLLSYALIETQGAAFDATKYNYIGSWGKEPYLLALGKDQPYKSVQELKSLKGIVFGVPDPVGTATSSSAIVIDFFGLDAKLVPGFRGADQGLAAAKGEILGYTQDGGTIKTDVDKGFIKPPILVISNEKSQYYPDTPVLSQVLQLTPQQQRLLTLQAMLCWEVVFYAPPGTPPDKVQFLRDAYEKIVKMDGFLAQAKLRWTIWTGTTPGIDVMKILNDVMAIPKEDVAAYTTLTQKYQK